LSRAGGAFIPIVLIIAIALESLFSTLWQRFPRTSSRVLVVLFAGVLLLVSSVQNYDLVFRQYNQQYLNATWNSSQMGKIARDYIHSIGHPDTVWVVAVPHWVDTRLVGINAGYPLKDYALWADQLETTVEVDAPKLFIVKPEDQVALENYASSTRRRASFYMTRAAMARIFSSIPSLDAGMIRPGALSACWKALRKPLLRHNPPRGREIPVVGCAANLCPC